QPSQQTLRLAQFLLDLPVTLLRLRPRLRLQEAQDGPVAAHLSQQRGVAGHLVVLLRQRLQQGGGAVEGGGSARGGGDEQGRRQAVVHRRQVVRVRGFGGVFLVEPVVQGDGLAEVLGRPGGLLPLHAQVAAVQVAVGEQGPARRVVGRGLAGGEELQ